MVFLKHNFLITVLIIIVFYTTGCAHSGKNVKAREVVLSPGITLCATQNNNNICITADKNNKRIIKWEGIVLPIALEKNRVELEPFYKNNELIIPIVLEPRQKRWHGKLGLVSKQPSNLLNTKKGLIWIQYEEAQFNYTSIKKYLEGFTYLQNLRERENRIFTDDGLYVYWSSKVMPDNKTLNISIVLLQLFINGQKPEYSPGSQNTKLIVTYEP